MSDSAILGAIIITAAFKAVPAIGYWALLYKIALVREIAAISIFYFGLNIFKECSNLIEYAVALCFKTTLTTVIQIFAIWAFFFGVQIWGLILSVNLLNTGIQQCPANDGNGCGILVILFGISLFSVSFKGYKGGGSRLSQ